MSRPIRFFKPDGVYFISGRCFQARLLLRPSKTTNAIIGGVLAKALEVFDVELFAFVFVSNHFHMLIRSKRAQIPVFMQYLLGNIAKKVGENVRWGGKFWGRRYDAAPVLDDTALVGRLRYILAHGVKEGLVARCQEWPGLTSIPELLDGARRSFCWPGNSNPNPKKLIATAAENTSELTVAPLPCWEDDDVSAQRERIKHLIAEVEKEAYEQRQGRPVLGKTFVLKQDPHDQPINIKQSRRPLCHTSNWATYLLYKAEYRAFVDAYKEALEEYRKTKSVIAFPLLSYHPPGIQPMMLQAA